MTELPILLVARADWTQADQYPDVEYDDRDGWAWEFLRRNPLYASGYAVFEAALHFKVAELILTRGDNENFFDGQGEESGFLSTFDEDDKFCLEWHISKPADPTVRWTDTSRPTIRNLKPRIIESPDLRAGEDEHHTVTYLSVPMTSHHALVRVDLNRDINAQLRTAAELFDKKRKVPTSLQQNAAWPGWRSSTLKPVLQSEFRVVTRNLHFILRALDAMAIELAEVNFSLSGAGAQPLAKKLLSQFQKDADNGRYENAPTLRLESVNGWMQNAYRYTWERGYIQIATEHEPSSVFMPQPED